MKAWEANSVLFFLPTIWWLDALKKEEITRENTFEQKKKKLGLKFNPGLALIGLLTTGPRVACARLSDSIVGTYWNEQRENKTRTTYWTTFHHHLGAWNRLGPAEQT